VFYCFSKLCNFVGYVDDANNIWASTCIDTTGDYSVFLRGVDGKR
jgi:hypothetical protein